MDRDLAPIVKLAYNSLQIKKIIEIVQENLLGSKGNLFIFIDGSKNSIDKHKGEKVINMFMKVMGLNLLN